MNNENIKEILNKLGAEDISADVYKIAEQTSANFSKTLSQPKQPILWEHIMKSPITKIAAAVVIIIAVLIGIHHFGGSVSMTSVAFSETIEAMKTMPWVHWTVTSETNKERIESWFCFASSVFAQKRGDGTILYNSQKENAEYIYDPQKGVLFFSQAESGIHESESLPNAPFQLVEIAINHLNEEDSQIIRKTIFEDDIEVEIITAAMAANSKTRQIQLRKDIQRNLLLSMRVDYKDPSKDSYYAEFEYPQDGPQSIYDLGVPQSVTIVSLIMPSDIPQMIKKLNTLRETTLTSYVAISVPSNIDQLPTSFTENRPPMYFSARDNLVSAIWRKNKDRCHSMGYFSEALGNISDLESMPEDVQGFAESPIAVKKSIYKASEKRIYTYHILNGKPVHNIRKGTVETYGSDVFIEQICWPRIVVPRNTPVHWKTESATASNGELLIMIERALESGNVARWFLNPARNYICQRHERLNPGSEGLIEILEYAKTSTGQWYPRKIRKSLHLSSVVAGEKALPTVSRMIYIEENPIFPNGIFDPRNLPKARE